MTKTLEMPELPVDEKTKCMVLVHPSEEWSQPWSMPNWASIVTPLPPELGDDVPIATKKLVVKKAPAKRAARKRAPRKAVTPPQ